MNKDELREWLDTIGQDRFWLAEKCGVAKSTVDSWFSTREIPDPALKIIEHLRREGAAWNDDPNSIKLTIAEFERIDRARQKAGYATRREFYRDAIIDAADRLLAAAKPEDDIALVSEKPAKKWGGGGKQKSA